MAEPKDTEEKKISFGPIYASLAVIGIYFGSQFGAGLLLGGYGALLGLSGQQMVQLSENSTIWQFSFILLVSLFSLMLLRFFLARRQISLAKIGLGRGPSASDGWNALATFGLYFVSVIAVIAGAKALFPQIDLDQQQLIGFEGARGLGALALVFVSLVILPPLVEEVMVRGFLYSGLKNKLKPILAGLAASIVFASAHLQIGSGEPLLWAAAIDTFVLSLFLVALRERTGSLWAGIFVHFGKNGLAFLALFVFI